MPEIARCVRKIGYAGWREDFGKRLDRSLAVKNRFITLTDDDLNKLAHSVDGIDFATMDLFGLLVALIKKNPKVLLAADPCNGSCATDIFKYSEIKDNLCDAVY